MADIISMPPNALFMTGRAMVAVLFLSNKVLVSKECSIATEHPLASLAGSDAMRAGGNAFDAAVAASFALSVVPPTLNGKGGDFFALF